LVVTDLGSTDPIALVKALTGQLGAARAENVSLTAQRDAALELGQTILDGTKSIVARVERLPVGRKTQAGIFESPELRKATADLDSLSGIYDADVMHILKKA
jgi:hypothetical protein